MHGGRAGGHGPIFFHSIQFNSIQFHSIPFTFPSMTPLTTIAITSQPTPATVVQTPLGAVARINPRWRNDRAAPDTMVAYVTHNVVSATEVTLCPERRRLDEIGRNAPTFQDNDVLVLNQWKALQAGKAGMASTGADYAHGFCTVSFAVIRPDPLQLDARYCLYFMRHPGMYERVALYVEAAVSAGRRPSPQAFLSELLLPLPPLAQQCYWAGELDRAFDACTAARRKLAALERQRRNFFRHFFGSTLTMRETWRETTLGTQLDAIIIGSGAMAQYRDSQGDALLRPCNVGDNVLLGTNLLHVRLPWGNWQSKRVQPGDVLMCTRTSGVAVAPPDIGVAHAGSGLAILRSSSLEPGFLAAFLLSGTGQGELEWFAITHGRRLSVGVIGSLRLAVPPLALQRQFVRESTQFDPDIAAARERLAQAMGCFDAVERAAFDTELAGA
jgi:type I restriction enzyme S subunit